MNWDDYIAEGKVKRTNKDLSRIKSLIDMSNNLLISLSRIKIDDINSSMIISNYYEALRLIIEALTIQYEFLVFSHEALTIFLRDILKEEGLSNQFDYYRKIRDKINYYGAHIEIKISKSSQKEIPKLIVQLKKYLE